MRARELFFFLVYSASNFSTGTLFKLYTIMLDEIHIKTYIDYKEGPVIGASNNRKPATTSHVFMVQSLLSSSNDVAHILLVSKMDAKTLH